MIVQRLDISKHALLRMMSAFLARAERPPAPPMERGDLHGDLMAGPPASDRPNPTSYRFHRLQPPQLALPTATTIGSFNYFPEGGAGIGWHTDSNSPGWRVYVARPLSADVGWFYSDAGLFQDDPLQATAFYVARPPRHFWHAVSAPGPRFSIGIRIQSDDVARELGLGVRHE